MEVNVQFVGQGSAGIVFVGAHYAFKISMGNCDAESDDLLTEQHRHALIHSSWKPYMMNGAFIRVPEPGKYYPSMDAAETDLGLRVVGVEDEDRQYPLYVMERLLPFPATFLGQVFRGHHPNKDSIINIQVAEPEEDEDPTRLSMSLAHLVEHLNLQRDDVMRDLGRIVEFLHFELDLDVLDTELCCARGVMVFMIDYSHISDFHSALHAAKALLATSKAKGTFPRDVTTRAWSRFEAGYMAQPRISGGARFEQAIAVMDKFRELLQNIK